MASFIKKYGKSEYCSCVSIQENQQGIDKDDKGNFEPRGDETECCFSRKLAMEKNGENPLQNLRFSNESYFKQQQ